MRKELEHIEVIEQYIFNELENESRELFENKLNENETLRDEVLIQHNLIEALQTQYLKKELEEIHSDYKKTKRKKSKITQLIFLSLLSLVYITSIIGDSKIILPQIPTLPIITNNGINIKGQEKNKENIISMYNDTSRVFKPSMISLDTIYPDVPKITFSSVIGSLMLNGDVLEKHLSAKFHMRGTNKYHYQQGSQFITSPSLSQDGNTLVYCLNERKILISKREDSGEWGKPEVIDIDTSEDPARTILKDPFLSSDGKYIYFVAHAESKKIHSEIWYIEKQVDAWSKPQRLYHNINTYQHELAPSLSPDGKTLFFVRDPSRTATGCSRIFKAQKLDDGSWGNPVILPSTINFECSTYPRMMPDNKTLVFSSLNSNEIGISSLYYSTYEGNDTWSQPQKIEVFKNTQKALCIAFSSSSNELFLTGIGRWFYRDKPCTSSIDISRYIKRDSETSEVILVDNLTSKSFQLSHLTFNTNSSKIKEEAKLELNRLIQFLKESPQIQLQIEAHTDDIGDDKSNQLLSERRASSVKNYLSTRGVSTQRLLTKGYGETLPLVENNSDKNRQKNRRVTFKVVF